MGKHEAEEEPVEGYPIGNQDPDQRGLGKTQEQDREDDAK